MRVAHDRIVTCSVCGAVDTRDPCTICSDERRDGATLVVVESVGDLWALERANATRARYHVLGGALSPLDGVGPDDLNLASLVARVGEGGVKEVVLAVNATVDGQTTAHYVTELLSPYAVKVTRLAHGVPVGGELDYLDDGTLAAAMRQRTTF
jgi:recombination protein RecR